MAPLTCNNPRMYCTHVPGIACSYCGMTVSQVMFLKNHPKPMSNDKIRKPIVKYRAGGKLKNRHGNEVYYR